MAASLSRLAPQADKVDIQNTTFSLDGVARFFCNTWDEVEAQQQEGGKPFDFIVIGSGMYGAYCAQLLYRLGEARWLRTLVLEAGPFLITEHIQNLARIGFDVGKMVQEVHWSSNIDNENNAGQRLDRYSPHYICIGGKSVFWGGWSPRLTEDDLSQWPAEVADHLRLSYPRLEGETGVKPDTDFIKGPLAEALRNRTTSVLTQVPNLDPTFPIDPPLAVQGESPESGLFSFDKFSSLPLLIDAIRDDTKRRDNERLLYLVPRARVIRIDTTTGVCRQIVAWVNGQIRRLDFAPSCQVILGLTTMNSTRLALESFPKTPSRADEIMGRNLMTHLRGNFTVRIRRTSFVVPLPDELTVGAVHVQGAHNNRRFHFQVYAAANATPSAEEFLYRMIPSLDDLDRILSSQDNEWITVTVRTVGEMIGDKTSPIHAPDKSWMDLSPFVRDVFGDFSVPSAFVHLTPTAGDSALWDAIDEAAFDFVLKLAGAPGNIQYRYKKPGDDNDGWHDERPNIHAFRDGLGTTFHESGTLWMGGNPAASVTDVSGRFHHVANAACVDQSLFPTVGSANPVLTGLTVTRKVASDLLDRFRSEAEPTIDAGFTTLLGNSVTDWSAAAGGANHFQFLAEISVLEAGTADDNVALGIFRYTPRTFRNFVLRLDWKAFSITANSGIFLRMPDPGPLDDAFYAQTIEIQIDERGFDFRSGRYGQGLHKTGAVYEAIPAQRWAARSLSPHNHPGYWNEFEITVQDNHVSVHLNGKIVSDGNLPAGKLADGFIGLQCHTQIVQFRNVRIKELP